MHILSARKLQSFGRPVFLSRQISEEEAECKNLALIRSRELLQQGANPTSLKVRDGVLYIRDRNKRTPGGENGNKSDTHTT